MNPLLGKNSTNPILTELRYIQKLLDECLAAMDEINNPKVGNVVWRLFFPAGQFMQQKSNAKSAAAILLNISARLHEILEVLEEKKDPILPLFHNLINQDFIDWAEKLVDLPERAQYLILEVEKEKTKIEVTIKKIEQYYISNPF